MARVHVYFLNMPYCIYTIAPAKNMPRSILNHALVKDHELGLNHSANTTIAIGPNAAPLHVDKSIGHNTYIGHGVAKLVVASTAVLQHNTAIGSDAMAANTGTRNVVLGYNALSAAGTADGNTSIGYISLMSTTSGAANVAVGYKAGSSIGTGARNVALGYEALGDVVSAQCSGNENICIGYQSGSFLTSGNGNIIIGEQEGLDSTTTRNDNIIIGNGLALSETNAGMIAIGNQAKNTRTVIAVSLDHNFLVGYNIKLSINNMLTTMNTDL